MSTGPEDIQTRIELDAGPFEQGVEAVLKASRRVADAELRRDRTLEDSSRRASRAYISEATRAAEEAIKSARKVQAAELQRDRALEDSARKKARIAEDQETEAAGKTVSKATKTARTLEDLAIKEARAKQDAERKTARVAEDEQLRIRKASDKTAKEAERDAKRTQSVREQSARQAAKTAEREQNRTARSAERAAAREVAAAQRAAEKAAENTKFIGRVAGAARGQVTRFAASFISVQAAINGLQRYVGGIQEIKNELREAADEAVRFRENQLEVGGVTGIRGAALSEEILKTQIETTLESPEKAGEYIQSFASSFDIVRDRGRFADAEYQELKKRGGQYIAAQGMPVSETVDLMGLIAERTGGQVKAADVLNQTNRAFEILKRGRGDLALLPQLAQFAGGAVDENNNLLNTVGEGAGLLAISSLAGQTDAKQRAQFLFNAAAIGPNDIREVKGSDRLSKEFFREIAGVTDDDDILEVTYKMFKAIEENKPENQNVNTYLFKQGQGRKAERMAIQTMYKYYLEGDLDRIFDFALAPEKPGEVEGVIQGRLGDIGAIATSARAAAERESLRRGEQALPFETMVNLAMMGRGPETRGAGGRFYDTVRGLGAISGEDVYRGQFERKAFESLRGAFNARPELRDELNQAMGFDWKANRGFNALPFGTTQEMAGSTMIRVLQDAGIDPIAMLGEAVSNAPGIDVGAAGGVGKNVEGIDRLRGAIEKVYQELKRGNDRMPAPGAPPNQARIRNRPGG